MWYKIQYNNYLNVSLVVGLFFFTCTPLNKKSDSFFCITLNTFIKKQAATFERVRRRQRASVGRRRREKTAAVQSAGSARTARSGPSVSSALRTQDTLVRRSRLRQHLPRRLSLNTTFSPSASTPPHGSSAPKTRLSFVGVFFFFFFFPVRG